VAVAEALDREFERVRVPWHGRGQGFESPKLHSKGPSQRPFEESNSPVDQGSRVTLLAKLLAKRVRFG
jgi:hypothetical protein